MLLVYSGWRIRTPPDVRGLEDLLKRHRYVCWLPASSKSGSRIHAGRHEHLTLFLPVQPITLIGIDELQTSWLASAEWRMSKFSCQGEVWPLLVHCPQLIMIDRASFFLVSDKQAAGNERGKTLFQSYSPPLMRKYRWVSCCQVAQHLIPYEFSSQLIPLMCNALVTPTGPGNRLDTLTGERTGRREVLFSFCPLDLLCSWGLLLSRPTMASDAIAAINPVLLWKRYSLLDVCVSTYIMFIILTYELLYVTGYFLKTMHYINHVSLSWLVRVWIALSDY